jgi:hypothetical protein
MGQETPIEVEANGLSNRDVLLRLVIPRMDRHDERLGKIETSQAAMKTKLDSVPTAETCPFKDSIEDSATFRTKTVAIAGVLVLMASILSGLLVHLLGG